MPVVKRAEAASASSEGNTYTGLATESTGAVEVVVVHTQKEPGATTVAHSHDREEVVIVISGRGSMTIGFEAHDVEPGDTVIIPPGAVHQLSVDGTEPFEAVLAKPAGIRFFSADGEELPTPDWMR